MNIRKLNRCALRIHAAHGMSVLEMHIFSLVHVDDIMQRQYLNNNLSIKQINECYTFQIECNPGVKSRR